ncbi:MAG: TRAP transporter small permease [Pseudomonadota bacterium]
MTPQAVTLIGRLNRGMTAVGRWLSYLAAALIVYILVHIVVEIVLRAVFDTSTFVLEEFVGYALGAMIFLALAATHTEDRLIRVNLLKNILGRRGQAVADVFANLAALAACLLLFGALYNIFTRNFRFGITSPSFAETPLWIPQSFIILGLGFYIIRLVVNVLVHAEKSIKAENS